MKQMYFAHTNALFTIMWIQCEPATVNYVVLRQPSIQAVSDRCFFCVRHCAVSPATAVCQLQVSRWDFKEFNEQKTVVARLCPQPIRRLPLNGTPVGLEVSVVSINCLWLHEETHTHARVILRPLSALLPIRN